ncbi:bifunctional 3'-5' exonuclease/DNA polymerase [Arthrobacter sunyaminii]|uniref:bifunctional 3'-5' exonuclease/DNA polymerase n=1 Tax=Arthrobacter sunyaminii TaxID=2816859 RepID=UPI001A946811|nr:bifunctional 3'-5' exonuclease/DNA polymerase [Arthrobacter sunyaminii]MBO0897502.1 bifunctional 3'-5' exonuclease/DNA polymerase [Arthrobacter sunyaminii]
MYVVLSAAGPASPAGSLLLQEMDETGQPGAAPAVVAPGHLAAAVRHYEERPQNIRWVFGSTRDIYPRLLDAGVTVERSHDLALVRGILRFSEAVPASPYIDKLRAETPGEDADLLPRQLLPVQPAPNQSSLFEELEGFDALAGRRGPSPEDQAAELQDQLAAVAASSAPGRLALLLAAESAGGLIAVEMEHAGLPWRRDIHEAMLEAELGPRPPEGQHPVRLEQLAAELRDKLGNPGFNPDSPQELLRALHRAGIEVKSTRSWELQQHEHPAIAPLLEYKRLSRLLSANGWTWLDAWVDGGRFRPEYVVGGVVSGRWASRGGGALQIPKYVRDAVRPDPGYRLIVADAAQLEPRVLAALGRDNALAAAARGKDLYQGIADQNFNGDRALAKMAMLGAMYGATSGEAGRLMPALTRSYPQAIGVVERGARAGEAGKTVSSHLGRTSPPVSERWLRAQQTASAEEQRRADSLARSQGRFTRNFVVQSTAAEWALCWLAEIRRRLRAASSSSPAGQLVFFLHDEVMLHVPADRADEVSALVTEAAAAATRLLFGRIPLEFPVVAVTVDSYAEAK